MHGQSIEILEITQRTGGGGREGGKGEDIQRSCATDTCLFRFFFVLRLFHYIEHHKLEHGTITEERDRPADGGKAVAPRAAQGGREVAGGEEA